MSHLLSTCFWSTTSFSGTGQLSEGPFLIGTVTKFFRAEVRGQINYEGVNFGDVSVLANFAAWGLQQVPHGDAAHDVVTDTDSDTWLARRQIGSQDYFSGYAPNTDTAAFFRGYSIADDWAGQLAIGAETDVYLAIKATEGNSLDNLNTFGTIRLWWA
jgi:hypothetical protein